MNNPKKSLAFILSLLLCQSIFADINSATITASTLKAFPHCVHYRIRGACYWMGAAGVNTTPYVEHYSPDVVVSVFNKPDENPWTEINLTLDKAGKVTQQQIVSGLTGFNVGSGQHSLADTHEQNVFFKEVDIIGNPALAVLPDIGLLPATAKPLMPYYQSLLDSAAWRGLPQIPTTQAEEAYAMIADIKHHIGGGLIDWGGIYPHEGKVSTSNDAKAAAVIAQRASDLITSSDAMYLTGHVFQKLPKKCGQECEAVPAQENSDKTQFQMIYPIETDTCEEFGKTTSYGEDAETKAHGAYVWVLWRFYSGCQDGIGKFIGKTIIN